jgi:hypothetical protein
MHMDHDEAMEFCHLRANRGNGEQAEEAYYLHFNDLFECYGYASLVEDIIEMTKRGLFD